MSNYHTSVLLQEAVDGLAVQSGEKYIDATLGAGGHSELIIDQGGLVLGIDQDQDAIEFVRENLKSQILNLKLKVLQGNFGKIYDLACENEFEGASGILFDLGVSSHQLDSKDRGFSFLYEAPLDMRMDTALVVSAKDLVNGLTKGEMIQLFTKYGEEPFAKRIAERIVEVRLRKPIETTKELADIVASVYPRGIHKVHPATKVFQALRIAVNDELYIVQEALPQALRLLKSGGRIVVISFHSLEDRIVKHTFLDWEEKGLGKILTKKPILPGEKELEENRRSRSSKMRIFEKKVKEM